MERRRNQAGQGRIGCVLWLVIVVAVGFYLWKAVPVKLDVAEFYDYIDDQAKFAQYTTEDNLKHQILARARELDLPVEEKNLSVSKAGDRIRIKVSFTVPLEFPGYTYHWKFHKEVDEPIFII